VVTEALACGTPVVGFARGALPELVDDDRGALVPPDDVDALAAAIALAGRRDRAACRRWVERHASLEAMTDRYESLYDELAG
jgi:glycosyltransferase involved in cell wall biosynthesis